MFKSTKFPLIQTTDCRYVQLQTSCLVVIVLYVFLFFQLVMSCVYYSKSMCYCYSHLRITSFVRRISLPTASLGRFALYIMNVGSARYLQLLE